MLPNPSIIRVLIPWPRFECRQCARLSATDPNGGRVQFAARRRARQQLATRLPRSDAAAVAVDDAAVDAATGAIACAIGDRRVRVSAQFNAITAT